MPADQPGPQDVQRGLAHEVEVAPEEVDPEQRVDDVVVEGNDDRSGEQRDPPVHDGTVSPADDAVAAGDGLVGDHEFGRLEDTAGQFTPRRQSDSVATPIPQDRGDQAVAEHRDRDSGQDEEQNSQPGGHAPHDGT